MRALWFLNYVLYHEMLHSVVPDEVYPSGRRRVHTEEFYRRENASFPDIGGPAAGKKRTSRAFCASAPPDRPMRS